MTPTPPSEDERLTPEEEAQIDAVCDDFERAWQAVRAGDAMPDLQTFADRYQGSARTALLRELIALDQAWRERHGLTVRPEDPKELGAKDEAPAPSPTHTLRCGADVPAGRPADWPSIPGLELVEVLGSGGMGVVFKARQGTLDRHVAVKFLRDAHRADPGQHERFLQEARAVARLRHPHLVQLYEFGEAAAAGGAASQPYLVLEYVPGGSLADLLRGSPQPPAEAARLVETLADAIHFAHQQGVIHRDLKPANVLLQTAEGARGSQPAPPRRLTADLCAKVTDFGLAKFLAGSDLTRSGDVLGTPSYMAPEQAAGKSAVTAAVDVYGLGAILYEALTGRAPFAGATADATLALVREAEPVPPRRLQPTVPRDLETICLKCLRKEPGRRYATAQDLADDLRRFRAGEPVRARPVGVGEWVVVWCRRKPVVAGLLAALAVVLAVGVSGFVWQWQLARQHEDEVKRAQARADANLKKLHEQVDHLSDLARDLGKDPRLSKAALTLLEEVLSTYQQMLPDEAVDPRLRQEAARMYGEVANTYHSTGKWRQAVDAYRRQAELLSALVRDEQGNSEHRRKLAVSCRNRGNVLRDLDETEEARAVYQQAAEVQEGLLSESPRDPALQAALANTLLNLATALSPEREANEIEALYGRVVKLDREAVDADRQNDHYQAELALALEELGLRLLARGKVEEAGAAIDEALTIHKRLLHVPAQQGYVEQYVAHNYVSQGRVLAAAGDAAGAEQAYKEAVTLLTPLVQENSAFPYHRMKLAAALTCWADLLRQTPRTNEAEALLRQAIGHYRMLKDNFPEDRKNARLLAGTYLTLVSWLWEQGRPEDAAEPYRLAFETAPDDPGVNNDLAWFLATAAEPRLRKPAEAVRLARKAVDARPESGNFWNTLGAAYYRNGDDKAAVAALEKSMALRAGGDANDWFFLAMAYCGQGDRETARMWLDRAVAWTVRRMPRDDELRRFRAEAEEMLAEAGKR
jgi:tetratricopeptide (TPR) repeat protein